MAEEPAVDTEITKAEQPVLDPADLELMHQSIHAEYRQALADTQWELSRANARNAVKDRIIADLRALLTPGHAPADA
ncbi:hypothetical protein [Arthrobacter sp. R-11]|uniref:hypothetical protein n=1 Tax=Arthrobacter sp. R-11 TaxID=3404053 RepID=UPI003CF3681E